MEGSTLAIQKYHDGRQKRPVARCARALYLTQSARIKIIFDPVMKSCQCPKADNYPARRWASLGRTGREPVPQMANLQAQALSPALVGLPCYPWDAIVRAGETDA